MLPNLRLSPFPLQLTFSSLSPSPNPPSPRSPEEETCRQREGEEEGRQDQHSLWKAEAGPARFPGSGDLKVRGPPVGSGLHQAPRPDPQGRQGLKVIHHREEKRA